MEGIVRAVCLSKARGTEKVNVGHGELQADWGLAGDAHAGHWHRQVSLLSADKIAAFNAKGAIYVYLLPSGRTWWWRGWISAPCRWAPGCGAARPFWRSPRSARSATATAPFFTVWGTASCPGGRFCQGTGERPGGSGRRDAGGSPPPAAALPGGGDHLSDRCAAGEREDKSGPAIVERLKQNGYEVIETLLLPDGRPALEKELRRLCDQRQPDLILTTGGTGFSPRDVTPEATLAVAERQAPALPRPSGRPVCASPPGPCWGGGCRSSGAGR